MTSQPPPPETDAFVRPSGDGTAPDDDGVTTTVDGAATAEANHAHHAEADVRDALGALATGTAPRVAIDYDALRRGRRASADVTAFAGFVADGGEERLERSLRAARRRDATAAASRAEALLDAIAAIRRAAAGDDE